MLQTPNQAWRENDTAWQFTKILTNLPFEYVGTEKQTTKKVGFCHLSFFFFLIQNSWLAYELKQLLSYFMHRTTSLSSQQPLSAHLSANWQEWQFWLAAVPQSCNTMPFWATNKRSRFRHVPIAHAQFTC